MVLEGRVAKWKCLLGVVQLIAVAGLEKCCLPLYKNEKRSPNGSGERKSQVRFTKIRTSGCRGCLTGSSDLFDAARLWFQRCLLRASFETFKVGCTAAAFFDFVGLLTHKFN